MNIYKAVNKARKHKRFITRKKYIRTMLASVKIKPTDSAECCIVCRMLYSIQEQQVLCKSLESVRRGLSCKRLDYSRLNERYHRFNLSDIVHNGIYIVFKAIFHINYSFVAKHRFIYNIIGEETM